MDDKVQLRAIIASLEDAITGCLVLGAEIGTLNTTTPATQLQLDDLIASRNRVLNDVRNANNIAGALLNP